MGLTAVGWGAAFENGIGVDALVASDGNLLGFVWRGDYGVQWVELFEGSKASVEHFALLAGLIAFFAGRPYRIKGLQGLAKVEDEAIQRRSGFARPLFPLFVVFLLLPT